MIDTYISNLVEKVDDVAQAADEGVQGEKIAGLGVAHPLLQLGAAAIGLCLQSPMRIKVSGHAESVTPAEAYGQGGVRSRDEPLSSGSPIP